ncbi:MAG TPA: molybdopterin cofactor-binding domain-containing protein [Steroidobacteraceae bacterium]|nr:molybdopterin cofactor-binding domain-containing protein [Steroidobacteraceae bacterium]
MSLTRRELLQSAGALVVAFSLPRVAFGQAAAAAQGEAIDAWLAIAADGRVTLCSGKVELGTGVQTAFAQLVADELDVPVERINVVMGDTQACPNQGPTVGSASVARGGAQVRRAAASARHMLLAMAATRLRVPVDQLSVKDGAVRTGNARSVSYAELIGGRKFDQPLQQDAQPKSQAQLRVVGQPVPRVELPAKIFGHHPYVHDLRAPGMLHGRVVRPPSPGARAESVDESTLEGRSADVRVLRKGSFIGIVAEREEDAIRAARKLSVKWSTGPALPAMKDLPAALRTAPAEDKAVSDTSAVESALQGAQAQLAAEYYVPHQMHASIGPSCAIADVRADRATLWSPTQSSFNLRDSVAGLLGLPAAAVRLIWTEGSGCYGHNGADDCTADAALLSQLAGKPVRVQWMRHDEHGNEPKGVAMLMAVKGGLGESGEVVAWDYEVWSPSHVNRSSGDSVGALLAGAQLDKPARPIEVGANFNADSPYAFANKRTVLHQLRRSPALRVSSFRGLGSPANTFANESFMDELAARAHADPIAFRIRHLKDERATAVLEAVAKLASWDARPSPRSPASASGRGVAFVHYNNSGAYVAAIVHVAVDRASGKVRVPYMAIAHDCGLIVNPDGVKNQIEGNVIQAMSRALLEEAQFDATSVTSLDWSGYPIVRFADVPQEIAITLINRPEQPMLGAGEAATSPIAPAIANAIFDATGVRLRALPFNAERVKQALA